MGKDPAAVSLGRKRWEGISDEAKIEFARAGAKARWLKTTAAERGQVGELLAAARRRKKALAELK